MTRHAAAPARTAGTRVLVVLAAALLGAAVLALATLRGLVLDPAADPAPPVLAVDAVAVAAPAPDAPPPAPPTPTAAPVPVPVTPGPLPPENGCGDATPVVVASGPLAAVEVCDDDGALTYRGTRTSDGASVALAARQDAGTWTATSGEVAYRLGEGELLITRAGEVLEAQVLERWWQARG